MVCIVLLLLLQYKILVSHSSKFEMNRTTEMFEDTALIEFEGSELPIGILVKVICIVSYALARLGNILSLGLIHYEKFGRDSQKRGLPDRIFTFNSLMAILIFTPIDTIVMFRLFYGPIGNITALAICYLISTLLSVPLGFAESILYQCLLIFFWKQFGMINDELLATFFIHFNIMIGQMISVIRLSIGFEKLFFKEYQLLSGNFSTDEEPR